MADSDGAEEHAENDNDHRAWKDSESLGFNQSNPGSDLDYIKVLDAESPGSADRILRLMEQAQRNERKAETLESWASIIRLVVLSLGIASVIGLGIYLIVHGEKGAAQTIFLGVNTVVTISLVVSTWSLWSSVRAERRSRDSSK
jgi:hypothetical protein